MKQTNIFKSVDGMTAKTVVSEKAKTRKAVRLRLSEYAPALEGAYRALLTDTDPRTRNVANALKGRYMTATNVVQACYPIQTAEPVVTEGTDTRGKRIVSVSGGALLVRKARKDETGLYRLGWDYTERVLTAAGARAVVRACVDNYIKTLGAPVVRVVEAGTFEPDNNTPEPAREYSAPESLK